MLLSLIGVVIGTVAGLHISTWGMYKDAIHEGFTVGRYSRSIVVGALVGLLLRPLVDVDLTTGSGMIVYFGMVYVVERVIVEIW